MGTVLVSLGSNVGDRAAAIRDALDRLATSRRTRVTASSSLLETKPAGGPESQENFLNAAALLETDLPPRELLSVLQKIENELGRVRAEHWGPRTIDLDLLLYDTLESYTPEVTLPHPRMSFRRFVLEPAAEIAADMVHPVCGNTVGGLLEHLNNAPRWIAYSGIELHEALGNVDQARRVTVAPYAYAEHPQVDAEQQLDLWRTDYLRRLHAAISELEPGDWIVAKWWSWLMKSAFGQAMPLGSLERFPPPRLLVIESSYIDSWRQMIRDWYRGPVLWLGVCAPDPGSCGRGGCGPDQVRDELLAAIAAME